MSFLLSFVLSILGITMRNQDRLITHERQKDAGSSNPHVTALLATDVTTHELSE